MGDSCQLRPASPADLAGLVSLERVAFSDPWSEAQLAEALASPQCLALVIDTGGSLAGYLIGRVVLDEAEILTLAVHPDHRRHGLGRRLLLAAMAWMSERGVRSVWLEVRVSNIGAQALYTGAGFTPSGVRRGYYRRPMEDALVLTRDLSTFASARPPLR